MSLANPQEWRANVEKSKGLSDNVKAAIFAIGMTSAMAIAGALGIKMVKSNSSASNGLEKGTRSNATETTDGQTSRSIEALVAQSKREEENTLVSNNAEVDEYGLTPAERREVDDLLETVFETEEAYKLTGVLGQAYILTKEKYGIKVADELIGLRGYKRLSEMENQYQEENIETYEALLKMDSH